MSTAYPGNPTPAQSAHADQNVASISEAVDALVKLDKPNTGDRAADVVWLAVDVLIPVLVRHSRPGEEQQVATAIAAELLLRLMTMRDETSGG